MNRYIVDLKQTHRTHQDFLLYFAINTIFTLENHRIVLGRKKSTLHRIVSDKDELFVVDYDPNNTCLPEAYLTSQSLGNAKLGDAITHEQIIAEYDAVKDQVESCILKTHGISKSTFDSWRNPKTTRSAANRKAESRNAATRKKIIAEYDELKDQAESNILNKYAITKLNLDSWRFQETEDSISILVVNNPISEPLKERLKVVKESVLMTCLTQNNALDFVNFITFLLCFGNKKLDVGKNTGNPGIQLQRDIYQMQEAALLFAANTDVQDKLYKLEVESLNTGSDGYSQNNPFIALYNEIDGVISRINDGKLAKCMDALYFGGERHSEENSPGVNAGRVNLQWGISRAYMRCFERTPPQILPKIDIGMDILQMLFAEAKPNAEDKPGEENSEPDPQPVEDIEKMMEGLSGNASNDESQNG